MSVERFVNELAAAENANTTVAELPSAASVWWRAELRRRFKSEQRAMLPLRIAHLASCGICAVAAVILAANQGPAGWIAGAGIAALGAGGVLVARQPLNSSSDS